MYSNNILNFQESKTILNACTKKLWKLIESTTYLKYVVLGSLYLKGPWILKILEIDKLILYSKWISPGEAIVLFVEFVVEF